MTINFAEHAANRAIGASAKAENLKALAELSATADHQADHNRGIVAATMAQIAAGATQRGTALRNGRSGHWV